MHSYLNKRPLLPPLQQSTASATNHATQATRHASSTLLYHCMQMPTPKPRIIESTSSLEGLCGPFKTPIPPDRNHQPACPRTAHGLPRIQSIDFTLQRPCHYRTIVCPQVLLYPCPNLALPPGAPPGALAKSNSHRSLMHAWPFSKYHRVTNSGPSGP